MPKTVKLIALFLFATLISAPNLSASTEQILYSFTGGDSQPGGVIFDQQGNLLDNDVVTSGVPEPASWTLMIAGFGLAGLAMRRRRKEGVLAAA